MTAAAYTTDLQTIDLAEAATAWAEPTATGWTAGGAPGQENDYYLQGSFCNSKTFAVVGGGLGGMLANYGSGITITSPTSVFVWIYFGCPNTLDTEANGGIRLIIGNDLANFKGWSLRGKDTYTYGGWLCLVIDPSLTADWTAGSPSTVKQYFGAACKTTATVSKGNPMGVDAIRYGREFRIYGGDLANGYATFTGAAAVNDATSARWGQLQAIDGGFLQQGLFIMGYSSAVDFQDANKSILIANTKKVVSTFNAFEVRNASSRVDWNAISILALGTVSRGNFITTDNADVNLDNCTFTDMGTFEFLSNSTINKTVFRRCNLITQSTAVFDQCTFDATNDSVKALLCNDPSKITKCRFVSGGTKHGIELTTACAGNTYNFVGNLFTGYGAAGTSDAAIYNNSGGAVTLNVSGDGDTPTIKNGAGASTTVNNTKTLTLTGLIANSEVRIYTHGTITELGGIENSSTSFAYGYTYSAGTYVDIVVHKVDKIYWRLDNYLLGSSDTSLPVQQLTDRQYENP